MPPKMFSIVFLGRQRDRDAAHAQSGEEAGHIEADVLQQNHHRDRGEEDLGGAPADRHQRGEAEPPIARKAVGESVAEEVQQPQRDPGQRDHSQALEQAAQEEMHRLGEGQHRQPRREEQDGEPEQDRPARAAQMMVLGHGVGAGHPRAQQAPRQQGRDRGQYEGDEEHDRQRDPLPEAQAEQALAAKRGGEPLLERRAPRRCGDRHHRGCRRLLLVDCRRGGSRHCRRRRRSSGRRRSLSESRHRYARERDQQGERSHQASRAGRASVVCSASARNGATRSAGIRQWRPVDRSTQT
jgi:hypothetical protein